MSLSCFRIPPRVSQQWYLSHPVPLGSSGLRPFLSFSLFLKTLTVMRSTAQGFCRLFLNVDLSNIFLLIRLGLLVLRGRPQRKSSKLITSNQGDLQSTCYCCWCDSVLLAEQMSNRFPHHKTALSSLAFYTVLFGGKSLCIASTPECRVLLHFFEDEECK